MAVSVEALKSLEHKITVSVPTEKIENEVRLRLKKLSNQVKMDGFRPGKIPMNVLENRYSDSVRLEVIKDLIEPTFHEAIEGKDLNLAGSPAIEPQSIEKGKDFVYTATFEVFPQFEINELDQATIELSSAEVTDKDVKDMLEKLRKQHAKWNEVAHAAKKDNKVVIDFEGFLDDKPFEGGSAKGHELVLGSKTMIPGFEEGIIGKKPGEAFDIKVKFPKDYGSTELADKDAVFKITLQQVLEPELPQLDDEFAKKFNIKDGLEALTKDIKSNMIRELEKRISLLNREIIFDKLMEINKIDLPTSLINQEVENLKHDAYHRIFGHEHHDDEKIPDFPRELFEEQANRRVHLGLLFSEYVKKHGIVAETDKIDTMIEKIASAYESPDELRQMYRTNKRHKAEIEALVLEELVAEKIASSAKVKHIKKDYDSVMNPQKGTEKKGE